VRLSATAQQAYEAIRRQIEEGKLCPGNHIVEAGLSEVLHMSRTPVREALRKLVDDRWLEYIPNRGMRVREWNRKDIQDNFRVRLLLESEAAAQAALHIEKSDIEELEMLNSQLRAIAGFRGREGAIEQMTDLNLKFHKLIWQVSDNRTLYEILHRNINLPTMYSTYRHYDQGKLLSSLDEHDLLVQYFKIREAEKARLVMKNHLHRAAAVFDRRE